MQEGFILKGNSPSVERLCRRLQKCFSSRNRTCSSCDSEKDLDQKPTKYALQDLHTNNREGVVKQVLGYYDRLYDRPH